MAETFVSLTHPVYDMLERIYKKFVVFAIRDERKAFYFAFDIVGESLRKFILMARDNVGRAACYSNFKSYLFFLRARLAKQKHQNKYTRGVYISQALTSIQRQALDLCVVVPLLIASRLTSRHEIYYETFSKALLQKYILSKTEICRFINIKNII